MEILVLRARKITENARRGVLFLDSDYQCRTLENNELEIPEGKYEAEIYPSPRNHRDVILLKSVPNRTMIEIHIANYPHELIGCIAVGLGSTDRSLINSTTAFEALIAKITSPFTVEVRNL